MDTIKKNGIIKVSGQLKKIIPLEIYVAWNLDKNIFCRPANSKYHKLLYGIWSSKEELKQDLGNLNYKIVTLDFSDKIPQDIQRILDFKDSHGWDNQERQRMIISKFRQLLHVFVFSNDDLKDKLKIKQFKG